jgi:hypothetical protein
MGYLKGSILGGCSPVAASCHAASNSSLWISIHACSNFILPLAISLLKYFRPEFRPMPRIPDTSHGYADFYAAFYPQSKYKQLCHRMSKLKALRYSISNQENNDFKSPLLIYPVYKKILLEVKQFQ